MTITSIEPIYRNRLPDSAPHRDGPFEQPQLWNVVEPPFQGFRELPTEGYNQTTTETAIVIDNGMDQHTLLSIKTSLTISRSQPSTCRLVI